MKLHNYEVNNSNPGVKFLNRLQRIFQSYLVNFKIESSISFAADGALAVVPCRANRVATTSRFTSSFYLAQLDR